MHRAPFPTPGRHGLPDSSHALPRTPHSPLPSSPYPPSLRLTFVPAVALPLYAAGFAAATPLPPHWHLPRTLPPGCFFTLSGDPASAAAALRPLVALRVLSLTNWHSLERGGRVEGGALRQCGATALVYLNLRASRCGTCIRGSRVVRQAGGGGQKKRLRQ